MKYAQHPEGRNENLQPAEIKHLVPGAKLFMRDPRQTPVSVTGTKAETASFFVRVDAFEDAGALWSFALWEVEKFAVNDEAAVLSQGEVDALTSRVPALNCQIEMACDPAAAAETELRISKRQKDIAEVLEVEGVSLPAKSLSSHSPLPPDQRACAALETVLKARGLWEVEQAFVQAYASNPNAGEMVKAHRIVLAELGLCPYVGQPLREPALLEPPWDRAQRRDHILTRLAFMRAMFGLRGEDHLKLYRAVYAKDALSAPRNNGFVSTTFRREVAMALFEAGEGQAAAALYMQRVPVARVFMTCLETPGLSDRYQEAEAVLLFDPEQQVF